MWRRAVDPNKVREAFEQVPRDCPVVDGVLLENFPLPTGANLIEHGLGRVPKGMIFCGQNEGSTGDVAGAGPCLFFIANNPIYPATATHAYVVSRFFTAAFTANIWVF